MPLLGLNIAWNGANTSLDVSNYIKKNSVKYSNCMRKIVKDKLFCWILLLLLVSNHGINYECTINFIGNDGNNEGDNDKSDEEEVDVV